MKWNRLTQYSQCTAVMAACSLCNDEMTHQSSFFCLPATTAGVEPLLSISGFILSSRRLRMVDRTFHNLVFAHGKFHLTDINVPKRKAGLPKNLPKDVVDC